MIGEKFIEKRIEDNKLIEISEIRNFDFDYEQLAISINDEITDDCEELFYEYGVMMDFDSFFGLKCDDRALENINKLIDERKEDEEDYDDLLKWKEALEKASGFTFYFKRQSDYYKGCDSL